MAGTSAKEDGATSEASPSLFQGKQFWLSHNIPQRNRFKEIIELICLWQHGGIIRLHEKDADIRLVDHKRKNLPSDAYSFRFVEDSYRKGKLQNLESYRAGPSAARPVGATNIPTRGHKVYYTLEDDQLLWDWMQRYEQNPKASIRGNKIYQELEAKNPRHTFQSYRDRYLKKLKGHPRPGGMPAPTGPPAFKKDPTATPPARAPRSESRDRSPGGPESTAIKGNEKKRKRSSGPNTPDEERADRVNEPNSKRRAIDVNNNLPDPFVSHVEAGKAAKSQDMPPPSTPRNIQKQKLKANETGQRGVPKEQQPLAQSPSLAGTLLLELPFLPSDDEPEEDESEQDIDTWIDDRLRTGKASSEEQILEALRCTSMDPHLADKVLAFLVDGKAVPDNMPGVWTPEDDKCVEGSETRGIQRVMEKHGSEAFNSRWEYLSMARAAGLVDTHK
ncbi:hypothetical protein BO94DRAFT_617613 [Aspergillus sclerotioniger CBS 115572]|uniref:DNA-binding protein RAP1 n=1 Tax=Aspergillus sclerotioniger CBS 115572 TaxID=1450535 RepID=A0A317X4P3_9EURO|nr:hypothetical protein BO94DRAFT_617613 [Aspergillus sclerotioniger CBS 115572]PWY91918.1 hypothetical protein BO94DRAFT_617613 [Aspergillus sclerotioniger CBS 115572]